MTEYISFTTRSGIKIIGEILADDPRTMTIRVTKARKPLTGKIMVFPKHDMVSPLTFSIKQVVS